MEEEPVKVVFYIHCGGCGFVWGEYFLIRTTLERAIYLAECGGRIFICPECKCVSNHKITRQMPTIRYFRH